MIRFKKNGLRSSVSMAGIVGLLLLVLVPQAARAGIEWHDLQNLTLPAEALDAATSVDGKLLFELTRGQILAYSLAEGKLVDRIPVDAAFTRIATADNDRVILTAGNPPAIRVMQVSTVFPVDISGRPFLGPANAPVTIAVFDDYQCPYCARLDEYLPQLMNKYPDKLKVVIKFFPLTSHKYSQQAAMAAMAAANQGKFWEFHHELLKNYSSLNEEKINSIAAGLSLDMTRFKADLDSAVSRKRIEDDRRNGQEIGVSGTPTVFINGKKVENLSLLPQMVINQVNASR